MESQKSLYFALQNNILLHWVVTKELLRAVWGLCPATDHLCECNEDIYLALMCFSQSEKK